MYTMECVYRVAEKDASLAMINKLTDVLKSTPSEEPGMNYVEKLQYRIGVMFPNHKLEYLTPEANVHKPMLLNCYVVLTKENNPGIILSYGSGLSEEEAKQNCAKISIQYLSKIKEAIPVEEEPVEPLDK